jgi:hypothetical protein
VVPEHAPIELLSTLAERRDIYGAVVLTYGADLAFFEEVILRGWLGTCREILVLMDAARYADSVRDLAGSVARAGVQYLPVPVQLEPPYVFHPKMVLLAGERMGRLLVGSGNLTFAGFGHNRETYSCFDWTPETPTFRPLFSSAWQFLEQIKQRWVFSKRAHTAVDKIAHVASWLVQDGIFENPADTQFFHSLERSILDQFCCLLATETVERLTVAVPFLDKNTKALASLQDRLRPKELCLVLQSNRTAGNLAGLQRLQQEGAPLRILTLDDESRYLHAKIYLAETDRRSVLMTGSANCSYAGLMGTPPGGNVEAVVVRSKDDRDGFGYLLDELKVADHGTVLDQVRLRSLPTLPAHPDRREVTLRDVSLSGSVLHAEYQLRDPAPEADIYLRLSTIPTTLQVLTHIDTGPHQTWKATLDEPSAAQCRRPVAADIVHRGDGTEPRAISNALWVTNVDALQEITRFSMRSIRQAAELLTGLASANEEEWRDFCGVLENLLKLEVRTVQGTSLTSLPPVTGGGKGGSHGPEKETVVVRPPAANNAGEPESNGMELERMLYRETSLAAILEEMRKSLPGIPRRPTRPGPNGGEGRDGSDSPPLPPVPAPLGERFARLLRQYRDSLLNPEYFRNKSVYVILGQYTVFQHLAQLLWSRGTLDTATFLQLSASINTACFNPLSDLAPLADPHWSRHLRVTYRDIWQESGTVEAALMSLTTICTVLPDLEDDQSKIAVYSQIPPVLASLASAAGVEHVFEANVRFCRSLAEAPELDVGLERVARGFVASANPGIRLQLDAWIQELGALLKDGDEDEVRDWEAARKQYLQANLDLLERWYGVVLRAQEADEDRLARAHQCQQYGMVMVRQRRYTEAAQAFGEAWALAGAADDPTFGDQCKTMLSWASMMAETNSNGHTNREQKHDTNPV